MTSVVADNPTSIIVQVPPAATNQGPSFTTTFLSQSLRLLSLIFSLQPMPSLLRIWTHYYPPGAFAFGEEALLMPGSTLNFIILGLLSFVEIKSQGKTGFPFQTHPQAIMLAITSLLFYGLASAVKYIVSSARPAPTSVYAVVAHLGMMVSLCILVGSLASLFYL